MLLKEAKGKMVEQILEGSYSGDADLDAELFLHCSNELESLASAGVRISYFSLRLCVDLVCRNERFNAKTQRKIADSE